jgi:hypothetical protein
MSASATFRPATREDCYTIAELFRIASGGVAKYVWRTLAPEYPGLTPLEIGARRYAREEGAFSNKNSAGRLSACCTPTQCSPSRRGKPASP